MLVKYYIAGNTNTGVETFDNLKFGTIQLIIQNPYNEVSCHYANRTGMC